VSAAGKLDEMRLRVLPDVTAPEVLTGVQIVLDTSAIAGFATATTADVSGDEPKPAAGCDADGTTVTCRLSGSLYRSLGYQMPYLLVRLKDGAELGQSGALTVTLKSDQMGPIIARSVISVADDVDLAAGPHHPTTTVAPGGVVDQPIEITNLGDKPVKGAALQLVVNTSGLDAAKTFDNCAYAADNHDIYCKFTEELAPGTTYRLAAPTAPRAGARRVRGPVQDDRLEHGQQRRVRVREDSGRLVVGVRFGLRVRFGLAGRWRRRGRRGGGWSRRWRAADHGLEHDAGRRRRIVAAGDRGLPFLPRPPEAHQLLRLNDVAVAGRGIPAAELTDIVRFDVATCTS
jgi:hypothetical protein